MKVHVTDEQRACVLVDLAAGRPYAEMMAEYGLSDYVIRNIARRAGMLRGPGIRPPEVILEVGQVFTRWTVLKPEVPGSAPRRALCRCECGTVRAVQICQLTNQLSKSCGCFKREASGQRLTELMTTHGLSDHPLYTRWESMMHRCYNPENRNYSSYGGRGITVHESLSAPEGYIAYVESLEVRAGLIGNADAIPGSALTPEQRAAVYAKLSLDRWPNNDGNYEPGNLRWATAKEQSVNSRAILYGSAPNR